MFPVVLVLVLLGVSIAAVAVDVLYDSADQPATADDESRSTWEPWPTIWRRVDGAGTRAMRSIQGTAARAARTSSGGAARAGSATGRAIVRTDRSARATADLAITGTAARAGNLRQRRALHRATREIRRVRAIADASDGATATAGVTPGAGTYPTSGPTPVATRPGPRVRSARLLADVRRHARLPAGLNAVAGASPPHAAVGAGVATSSAASGDATAMPDDTPTVRNERAVAAGDTPAGEAPAGPSTGGTATLTGTNARASTVTMGPPGTTGGGSSGPAPGPAERGRRRRRATAADALDRQAANRATGRWRRARGVPGRPGRRGPGRLPADGSGAERRPEGSVPLVDPRQRAGVAVPLGTPALTRVKAVVELLVITTVLGIAVAGVIVALALAVFQALAGL